jgi:hypothetical protein
VRRSKSDGAKHVSAALIERFFGAEIVALATQFALWRGRA